MRLSDLCDDMSDPEIERNELSLDGGELKALVKAIRQTLEDFRAESTGQLPQNKQ